MATIAVIGAGSDRRKFGNRCVRAFQALGYTVYPVHPREERVEGCAAYADISGVPAGRLDLVSIYLGRDAALGVLDSVAKREVGELWLNPGADHPDVVQRARELGLPVRLGCSIITYGSMPTDE